jgi:CO/xanthine dehydrogenase FAD-binding subunit
VNLNEYYSPTSIKEALDILMSYQDGARVIAGGTDLIPELKAKSLDVECLIDITNISELKKITFDNSFINIGAGVTHAEVASSEMIWEKATVLAEAASAVGSPLIRNQGTVVGNVISAQPAADTAVALFSLEAEAEIVSHQGVKILPIAELYEGVGISKIDSSKEIITKIRFKSLRPSQGSAFARLSQRKALALPVLNASATVAIKDNCFAEARITLAPVSPIPFRLRKAEAALKNALVGSESIQKAAEIALEEVHPRESALRGSASYRQEMAKVIFKKVLARAVERAIVEDNSLSSKR